MRTDPANIALLIKEGEGMREALTAAGLEHPEIINESFFSIIFKRPLAESGEDLNLVNDVHKVLVEAPVTGEVTGEVLRMLKILAKAPLTRSEIQSALELKSQANFRDRYLKPALESGYIEMTIPDKPNSRLQKYRISQVRSHVE